MFFRPYQTPKGSPLQKIQDTINKGLEIYQDHYDFGGHFSESNREQLQEQRDIMQEFRLGNLDLPQLQRMLRLRVIDASVNNFLDLATDLRDENFWDSLNYGRHFDTVKNKWLTQSKYAHFTVDALFVSDKILTDLCDLVKQAKKKAKDYPAHGKYLIDMDAWIIEERGLIARALFYRLDIAYHQLSFTKYQPIPYILEKLEQFKVDKFSKLRSNTEVNRSEGEFPFIQAFAYIRAHGSNVLKQALKSYLVINNSSGNIAVELIQQGQNSCLVPETIKEFIPLRRPFWSLIIPGYKRRYQFMQNKTALLIEIMSLQKASFPPNTSCHLNHPYWQYLSELQTAFNDELRQSRQHNTWFPFLYKSTNQMLSNWRNLLTKQQVKVTNIQIDFLHSYASNLSPDDEIHNIQAQLEEVEKTIDTLSMVEERRRFFSIKDTILKELGSENPSHPSAKQSGLSSMLHDFVENNKPLTDAFWTDFANLKAHDIREFKRFVELNNVYFTSITEKVIKQLSQLPAFIQRQQNVIGITAHLLQVSKLLEQVLPFLSNRSEMLVGLKQVLMESFGAYPEFIKTLQRKDVEKRKFSFEKINEALFAIVSLDESMDQEKQFFLSADGFLRDILAGRQPLSVDEKASEVREFCQDNENSILKSQSERKQRMEQLKNIETSDSDDSENDESISNRLKR